MLLNMSEMLDLVQFVKFKKREKHPSGSVIFSEVGGFSRKKNFTVPSTCLILIFI